jgi:cysteinyl-tRNA synthetase
MVLKLYNTLTRKKQVFKPIKDKQVGFYSCGPTVYNYAHIGNLRTYIFNDILGRVLLYLGFNVTQVMNLTDVDDKTIKGSLKEGKSLKEFTEKYAKIFFEDLHQLNIKDPKIILKATESISDMVELIKTLMKNGYAYKTNDGIYFSISKFKNYGKLAGLEKIKDRKERVRNDEYDKENAQDFALWKFWTEEDADVFWNTEIGKGRPGWHIECSAMSMKHLGETLDIHTGATDLIFPHHTNEIAQSEAATGKKFVNYWMHAGFLNMKEGKMSKSLGNVFYLKDLAEKGFSPLHYRFMCLLTHYRSSLDFSLENLTAAKNGYIGLKNKIANIIPTQQGFGKDSEGKKYLEEFGKALEDDLNMPLAVQVLQKLLKDEKVSGKAKLSIVEKMDEVFGLDLLKSEKIRVPEEVRKLAEERWNAKKIKNWAKSDEMRDKIKALGFVVNDTPEGYEIKKA